MKAIIPEEQPHPEAEATTRKQLVAVFASRNSRKILICKFTFAITINKRLPDR
jgi:hypothetical protein